jgi:hypothetical protein
MQPHRSALFPVGALLFLAQNGCLCPPCAEAPGTATEGGGDGPARVAAAGDSEVIWDGDTTGGSAQGWADCDAKPNCKATVGVADGEGVDGGKAVRFHGEGPKWIGMGWNWHGWWPKGAGTDISPYDTFTFSIRIVLDDPKQAPDPSGLSVALRCGKGEKNSANVTLEKYLKNPGDGKWHDVEIPLAQFYKGKEGQEFDPKSAWEINLSGWQSDPRKFDMYLDNIAVKKN